MAYTLDFNALDRPVLELTLKDDAHTLVRVTTPTEGLLARMMTASKDLEKIAKKNDPATIDRLYDLHAEVISCNLSGLTITGAELRGTYGLTLYDLIVFTGVYLDFIKDIKSAKN